MTYPTNFAGPAGFDTDSCTIVPATGTAALVLVDPAPAAAATPTSPLYTGGQTIIDATVTSSDSAAKDVIPWIGKVLTTQETTNTGAMATTSNSISRTNGSFIADKWKAGDQVMVFAPRNTAPNAAVDGIVATLSGVTALGLTVAGTPFAGLTLAAGTRICKMSPLFRINVPAGSGTNGTAKNVALINASTADNSAITTERKLGPTDLLAISAQAAVTASCYINATVQLARY